MTDDIRPLRLAAGLLIATGAIVGLGAVPGIGGPIWAAHDLIVWPYDGGGAASIPESRLFAAICGGVLVGWGVMIWHLAALIPREGAAIRRIVWTGGLAWFVVDSGLSVVAGGALNVIPNLVFLAVFWWALRPRAVPVAT
jgi:hypothetical protein